MSDWLCDTDGNDRTAIIRKVDTNVGARLPNKASKGIDGFNRDATALLPNDQKAKLNP